MAEAKAREISDTPRERFTQAVFTFDDEQAGGLVVCMLMPDGKVYRMSPTSRVRDKELIEATHQAARDGGFVESKIIRPAKSNIILPK